MNEEPINTNETSEQIVLPFDPPLEERPDAANEPSELDFLRGKMPSFRLI